MKINKSLTAISFLGLLHLAMNALAAMPSDCSLEKIAEVLAPARIAAPAVRVDCHLTLDKNNVITKRMILEGARSSGVRVDCNSAKLDGGEGTVNYRKDMIEVRSRKYRDAGTDTWKWERPENITIRNCDITGSVRIWGMAQNGQGDDLRVSSRLPGHIERARNNAPEGIFLDNVKITGVGRIPLYISPGVTHSGLVNSEIKGISLSVAVYLDAESYGNTIKNNYIHAVTRREAIAIDGSGANRIEGNTLSELSNGGIYLYRNCGEGGTVRHSVPELNTIADNVFYYDGHKNGDPAVYLGARNGRSLYCGADRGFPYGSSVSDLDHARQNRVMRNRFYNGSPGDVIRSGNAVTDSPNLIGDNVTIQGDGARN